MPRSSRGKVNIFTSCIRKILLELRLVPPHLGSSCLLLIDIVKDYPNARRSSDGMRVAKVIARAMKKMFSAAQSP